jgi:hypothetical protein
MSLPEQKAMLLPLLHKAMELELATIPPYLTALLSIQLPGNRAAAKLIRSVAVEEMLHMVLVGNLISSLGGKVCLHGASVPGYPLKLEFEGSPINERDFEINLEAFSPQAIETFKKIELPASLMPPARAWRRRRRSSFQALRWASSTTASSCCCSAYAPTMPKAMCFAAARSIRSMNSITGAAAASPLW